MTGFQSLVRPNETPSIRPGPSPDIRRAPVVPETPEDNLVVWGSSGNNIFALQASYNLVPKKPMYEEQREYSIMKVMNPDDHEQYVETEVMTKYTSRGKEDKNKFVMNFAPPTASEHVEIISKANIRNAPEG